NGANLHSGVTKGSNFHVLCSDLHDAIYVKTGAFALADYWCLGHIADIYWQSRFCKYIASCHQSDYLKPQGPVTEKKK
ncbi:MAG: hypothetical protein ACI9BC_002723, partial [Crocinitomicaceae bacterium]